MDTPSQHTVIVGAGAAGLTAAIFAARAGVPVTLLETRPQPGAKIRVSGGGRCNVLPSRVSLDDFHTSGSRNAMRNILFSWPLDEVRAFFEDDLGIPLKVEATGKVFPRSNKSRDVVDALLNALDESGAVLHAPFRVESIDARDDGFAVSGAGETLHCSHLVLATGGLSLPKSGSDGAGMEMTLRMGHTRVPTYPALVPLLTRDTRWHGLSGVSVPVWISVESDGKPVEQRSGDFLFTHRGFSGPVVLDVSYHVTSQGGDVSLLVHWGGRNVGDWDHAIRNGGRATVSSLLRRYLPDRLTEALMQRAGANPSWKVSELKRDARLRLVETLSRYRLPVSGNEGYATAEVTGGGLPVGEVKPATLESRIVPGLYLCGEILDVTGRIGGYNFLWAWVTGRKVGRALAATGD